MVKGVVNHIGVLTLDCERYITSLKDVDARCSITISALFSRTELLTEQNIGRTLGLWQ